VEKELKKLRDQYAQIPLMVRMQGGFFFDQLFVTLASMQAAIAHAEGMAGRSERD
jgi:hypothetical protein